MNAARKYRDLIHEAARFGVVGGLGVVVTDGGTNLLRESARLPEVGLAGGRGRGA